MLNEINVRLETLRRLKRLLESPYAQEARVAIAAMACLTLAYYWGSNIPYWVKTSERFPGIDVDQKRNIFFILECLTLFMVFATQAAGLKVQRGGKKLLPKQRGIAELSIFAALFSLTLGYGLSSVGPGEPACIRVFYSLFSCLILTIWYENLKSLSVAVVKPFLDLIYSLEENPEELHSRSPDITVAVNLVVLCTIIMIAPILIWLPTLVAGPINPRSIAFSAGIATCLIVLLAPGFAHYKIERIFHRSLTPLSRQISWRIATPPANKEEIDYLKGLIEVKDSLTKSILSPAKALFLPLVQVVTTITALIAAYRGVIK